MGRFSSLIRFCLVSAQLDTPSEKYSPLSRMASPFSSPGFDVWSTHLHPRQQPNLLQLRHRPISGHATDPNSEILLIQNGQTIAKAKPDPQSKDFYLDLTSLSSGTHTYSVMACSQKKSDNCSSRQPVTVTVGSVAGATSTPAAATSPTPTPANLVQITNVIDGDTVRLSINKVVRLIGIDTPEIHLER